MIYSLFSHVHTEVCLYYKQGLVLTLDLDMFVMVNKFLHCFSSVKADLQSVHYIHSLNSPTNDQAAAICEKNAKLNLKD